MRSSTALMAAAALLLLVSLAAADLSRSEQEARRMFVEWMAKHGKTYGSIGEEERRYAVFKDNLRLIDEENAAAVAAHSSSRLGLTVFADLTDEEFRTCCLGGYIPQADEDEDVPDSVHWGKKGAAVAE
ncbi:hypothetical protein ACP70R_049013 [Stipagrostis hirtigluma subsp. patula]